MTLPKWITSTALALALSTQAQYSQAELFTDQGQVLGWQFDASHVVSSDGTPGESYQELDQSFLQYRGAHNDLQYGFATAGDLDHRFYQAEVSTPIAGSRFAVSGFSGTGQNQFDVASSYQDIDPFLFHGGTRAEYDYRGTVLGWQAKDSQMNINLAYATIDQASKETRESWRFGIANGVHSADAVVLNLGQNQVAQGFGFNTQLAGWQIGSQYLGSDNGVEFRQLNFAKQHNHINYGMQLSQSRNPLFGEKDDNRVLLSMSWQTQPDGFGFDSSNSPAAKKRKRNTIIGASVAAVAVAVLASSGSSSSDGSTRLRAQHEAARSRLNSINPRSVAENREFGGAIYVNPDGSFSSTEPVPGDNSSVNINPAIATIPADGILTASYHTHAGFDPAFDSENFSPNDIISDRILGTDGYLATPMGSFRFHNVTNGRISTLGTVAN